MAKAAMDAQDAARADNQRAQLKEAFGLFDENGDGLS